MKKTALAILLVIMMCTSLSAQRIGEWNTHFSYENNITQIVQGDGIIYALSVDPASDRPDGKLFSFNPSDNTYEIYHKAVNGEYITNIAYSKKHGCLIIFRANADIDLLYSNNNMVNIPDLKNMTSNLDKKLNEIYIDDDYAYLSTNFGLLIINLPKQEIKESVVFRYPFYSSCIFENELYVSTSNGTKKIDLNKNIQYPDNWESLSFSSQYSYTDEYTFADSEIRSFTVFDNKLVFLIPEKALYYVVGNKVERLLRGSAPSILVKSDDRLILSKKGRIWDFSSMPSSPIYINMPNYNLNYAMPSKEGANRYWVGFDNENLSEIAVNIETSIYEYTVSDGFTRNKLRPSGPLSNYPFFMTFDRSKLYVAGGAADANQWNYPARISEYKADSWFNYDRTVINEKFDINARDILSVVIDPNDPDHFFAGSWNGEGLYEFKNRECIELYNQENSTLTPVSTYTVFMRVNGMLFDNSGNLWMANSMTDNTIKVRKKDGTWTKVIYPQIDYKDAQGQTTSNRPVNNYRGFIMDKYGNKWLSTFSSETGLHIFVFNENGTLENTTDDKTKLINSFYDQDGKLLDLSFIFALKEDLSGNIWVGTRNGIFVIYNSANILSSTKDIVLNKIKIPRNDGTNNADILLENIRVNNIAVDGGNRKWIATTLGLYVVSANGQETIHHFTMENSPLPANMVLSVTIDPDTGIAYIGTEKGIVSFRGEATEGAKDYSNVYAFPNPVQPDYDGPITVTGLKANSTVKITDVRGNLINQGTSVGGQYIWNGRNVNKDRVDTGVYIVFGSSEDGKDGVVTKILVVN